MTDSTVTQKPRTPHCYRHPKVETWVGCSRCGRPICPDCMREASVGFQCPDCYYPGGRMPRGEMAVHAKGALAGTILIAIIAVLVLTLTGIFSPVGTPNVLVAGGAGAITGWFYWRQSGRVWNTITARWSMLIGLAIPIVATLLLLTIHAFHHGPGPIGLNPNIFAGLINLLLFILRVAIASAICMLFTWLLATPPSD